MEYLFPFLVLGVRFLKDILGFESDSSSEEEYPLEVFAGMPDSARWSRSIPMQEPTSRTTSSWGALLTSQPFTANRQSPAWSPARSAELCGTTQLKIQGACPDIVKPKPWCPRTSLATLNAGWVWCVVIGGEKGLARAFFWRLDACIMKIFLFTSYRKQAYSFWPQAVCYLVTQEKQLGYFTRMIRSDCGYRWSELDYS